MKTAVRTLRQFLLIGISMLSCGVALGGNRCPRYQVWGGNKCEWIAFCEDNRPWQGQCSPVGVVPCEGGTVVGETCHCPEGTAYEGGLCEEIVPKKEPRLHPGKQRQVSSPQTEQPEPLQPQPLRPPPFQPPPFQPPPLQNCPPGSQLVGGRCAPVIQPCELRTIFTPSSSSGKRVLLVNGNALQLFDRYLRDLDENHKSPDWGHLHVIIFEGGRRVEISAELTMGDYFIGRSYKDKWRSTLRRRTAGNRSSPMNDFKALDSDVICGAQ